MKSIAPGAIRTHDPRIRNPVLYPPELRGRKCKILCRFAFYLLPSFAKTGQTAMDFYHLSKFLFSVRKFSIIRQVSLCFELFLSWLLTLATIIAACSSAPPPLVIKMYHPETKQSLTCAAKDQPSMASNSPALASAVETCARHLEAQGFVREK